jgi:hypothetical protein
MSTALVNPQPTATVQHPAAGSVKVHVKHVARRTSHLDMDEVTTNSQLGQWIGTNLISFELRNLQVTFADRIMFKMVIANTHPTLSATLVPLNWLFQNITLFANGSNNLPVIIPESDFFAHLPSIDIPKTEALASYQNWDPATYISHIPAVVPGNPVTGYDPIPPGGVREYWYEFNSILNQAQLPISEAFSKMWRIQFQLNQGNIFVSNSNSPPMSAITLQSMQCYVIGDVLHEREHAKLLSEMNANTHVYFGYMPMLMAETKGSLPNGTVIRQTLNNFDGRFNQLIFGIREATTSDERRYQYNATTGTDPSSMELTDITVYDGTSKALWTNSLGDALMRRILARLYFDSRFDLGFRVYRQLADEFPTESTEEGHLGTMRVTTNFRIEATNVASNGVLIEFFILGMQLYRIEIDRNGKVTAAAE